MKDGIYVSMLWGASPIHPPKIYSFNTCEEKDAFLYGVYEAVGWMEAEHLEHDEPVKFTLEDFDMNEEDVDPYFLTEWKKYEEGEFKYENL